MKLYSLMYTIWKRSVAPHQQFVAADDDVSARTKLRCWLQTEFGHDQAKIDILETVEMTDELVI